MSNQLHNSLVRTLTADGMPVGVGFVTAKNLILNCTHVIERNGSDKTAHFGLPLLTPGESFSGCFDFMDDEQDIAVIGAMEDVSSGPVLSEVNCSCFGKSLKAGRGL